MRKTIARLAIILACGILSALSTKYLPAVLIITGVMMVLTAAESVTETKVLPVATTVCAALLGALSGRWWGFLAFGSVSVVLPAVTAAAATASYLVCALTGIASTQFLGIRKAAEAVGARQTAKLIVMALLVFACVCAIRVLFSLADAQAKKREAEQQRIRQSMISELHERKLNREMAQQSFAAEKNARLLERENISRNIHNNVGHSITAAIMTLDAADMLFEAKPEEARKRMNDANDRIRGSLESIRSAVRALDDEGGEVPFSDLRRYLDNVAEGFTMDTERKVDTTYETFSEDILIPKEHAEFLTGVLQECLSNGVRHGGADKFAMALQADAGHVRMTVTDNGTGDFGEANRDGRIAAGFGLKKIDSYVKRCGGLASYDNDEGFRTVVELPLTPGGESV